jgi:hypothetical protein
MFRNRQCGVRLANSHDSSGKGVASAPAGLNYGLNVALASAPIFGEFIGRRMVKPAGPIGLRRKQGDAAGFDG